MTMRYDETHQEDIRPYTSMTSSKGSLNIYPTTAVRIRVTHSPLEYSINQ